jgi:biopolymer transport protein ExbD
VITCPLELQSRLRPAPRDLDFFAWVSVGVIALFFSLLGSRFILAPGMLVELPKMSPASMRAVETSVVVVYRRDEVILFGTGMYSLADLKKPLEEQAKNHPGSTLHVIADRQVSTQALAKLGELAAAAGFVNMLVAGDRASAEEPSRAP